MRPAVFVDLDRTLISFNSLEKSVEYLIFSKLCLVKITQLLVFKCLRIVGLKTRLPSKRLFYINLLKGFSKEEIQNSVSKRMNSCMPRAVNKPVLEYIVQAKKEDKRVVLVTGTIAEVAYEAQKLFKLDAVISSVLDYDCRGNCSGKLAIDCYGQKYQKILNDQSEGDQIDFSQSLIITDNREDLPLFRLFGDGIAIVNNSLSEQFWKDHGVPKVLYLPSIYRVTIPEFVFPGIYSIKYRIGILDLLLLRLGLPIFIVGVEKIAFVLLAWWLFIAIYEIGYIDNDFLAIKTEKKPSLRLPDSFQWGHFNSFIAIRVIFAFLLFLILKNQGLILASGLVLAVFAIHNRLYQPVRIITYPLLKLSHFIVPVIGLMPFLLWKPYLSLLVGVFLPIPLLRYLKKMYVLQVSFCRTYLVGYCMSVCIVMLYSFEAHQISRGAIGYFLVVMAFLSGNQLYKFLKG